MRRAAILALALILITGCESLRNRWRWASMGDMPLICCGGPGNYIEHAATPTFTEAFGEYTQIVNLPGGCGSFTPDTKAGRLAASAERKLTLWSRCPDRCRADYSTAVAADLRTLKEATVEMGPSVKATHGPPCFDTGSVTPARAAGR